MIVRGAEQSTAHGNDNIAEPWSRIIVRWTGKLYFLHNFSYHVGRMRGSQKGREEGMRDVDGERYFGPPQGQRIHECVEISGL